MPFNWLNSQKNLKINIKYFMNLKHKKKNGILLMHNYLLNYKEMLINHY